MIVVVSPEEAARSWHVFEPMIKTATDKSNGCYEPVDVLRAVLDGKQVMLAAVENPERGPVYAVATIAIVEYPRKKVCRVIWIAGDHMSKWLSEFIEVVEKYARENGAAGGEGFLRRGWVKLWPGAVEHGVTIYKDLTK